MNGALISLEETIAIAREESRADGHLTMAEWESLWEAWDYEQEVRAEQLAETAYERYLDYRAWLRDGWQPKEAF